MVGTIFVLAFASSIPAFFSAELKEFFSNKEVYSKEEKEQMKQVVNEYAKKRNIKLK